MSPSLASRKPKRRGNSSDQRRSHSAPAPLSDLQLVILSRAAQHPECLTSLEGGADGEATRRATRNLLERGLLIAASPAASKPRRGALGETAPEYWRITRSGLAVIGVAPSELSKECQQLVVGLDGGPSADAVRPKEARTRGDRRGDVKHPPVAKTRIRSSRRTSPGQAAPAQPSRRGTGATTEPKIRPAAEPGKTTSKSTNKETSGTRLLGLLCREDGATIPEIMQATGWLAHSSRAALTGLRKKGHAILREQHVGGRGTVYRIAAEPGPLAGQEA